MEKEEFLEEANKANGDALRGKTITDLLDKDSSVYKIEREELPKIVRPPRPTIDVDGFSSIPSGRTFNQDLTGAVKNDNLSMIKVALKNEQYKSAHAEEPEEINKNNFKIIIGITFFLAVAGGLFIWVFLKTKPPVITNTPAVNSIKTVPSVIFSEEITKINISKKAERNFQTELVQELGKKRGKDSIEELSLVYKESEGVERPALGYEAREAIGLVPPEALTRSLEEKIFLGIWSDGIKSEPLLILRSDSPQSILTNMLAWETTLKDEARSIFGTYYTESSYALSFKDKVVLNQDVRVLQNSSGVSVFFYTILDKNHIVFARSSSALKRVLERLREQKLN